MPLPDGPQRELAPADVLRALAERGAAAPPRLECHASLGSTNDRLKDLARDGAPEWTLVMAERQTGGRGREGRVWTSPPGGLYLSVLLRPRFSAVGLVPLAAGIAVAEAAAEHGTRALLKWPNDVVVETDGAPRKLAGILAEAASGQAGTDWIVLGVGVNVRLFPEAWPEELISQVASLADGGAAAPDVPAAAAAVVARLRVWYDALGSSPIDVIRAWRGRALRWWGETVEVRVADGALRGTLTGIDADGALLVEVAGEVKRLASGEVTRLRREG